MAKNIKGRKFVATAASAALVASAIVPVASAAADFADQSKISSWAADAVEHAVEQGYMKGSNGSFNPQGTITKAEVAQVIFNALDLAPVTGGSFTDVPADAWFAGAVNAVAAKGIVSGTGAGTFEPNKAVTLAEAANMIVKALGIKGQADLSKFADASSVPTWANEAIQALVANGYIKGASNNGVLTLGALDNLSRERFATFFVATAVDTIEAGEQTGPVTVKDLTVAGAKKLELTFAYPVDAPEKAVLTVKKGTINVNIDEWKFSDDKKSVVITTTTKLSKGDYTVTLSGLTTEAISKTVTAADEKVSTINVLSTTAPMNEAAQPIDGVSYAANQTAFVKYAVLNQYGEKMNISGITWSNSTGGKVLDNTTTGTLTIGNTVAAGVNFIPNNKVYLTGVHGPSATVVNAEVTIGLPSKVATTEIAGVFDTSTNKFVDLPAGFASNRYVLLFTPKDQYGNVMNLTSIDALTVLSNNPLFVASPTTFVDNVAVGNDVYEGLALVGGQQSDKGGTAELQIISNNTGLSSKYTIKADATAVVTSFQMSPPAELVAGGEKVEIPFTALDQYGNPVTKHTALAGKVNVSAAGTGVTTEDIYFELQKDGSAKLFFNAPANPTNFDSITSLTTTVAGNGNYSNVQLAVKPDAVPTTVIGLDKDISTSIAKNGGVTTITAADLLVQDQYGRTIDADTIENWLDASVPGADNAIVVESNSTATTAFAVTSTQTSPDSALVVLTSSTDEIYVAANSGTTATAESLKFSLSTTAAPAAVTTSSKTVAFTAVAQSQFVSYELGEVGTIYNDGVSGTATAAKYNKTVKVYGVTEAGAKVEIPADLYAVTVTSGKLGTNGNKLVDLGANGYVAGDFQEPITSAPKTLTAKISVVVKDAGTQAAAAVLAQDVTVSNATPVAATFRLHRDVTNETAFVSTTTGNTITAATLNGFITQVKDQYGVDITDDATYGSPRTITVSNVVKTSGSRITVAGNVTSSVEIQNASAGDKFNVTYTYAGGKTVTISFIVAAR